MNRTRISHENKDVVKGLGDRARTDATRRAANKAGRALQQHKNILINIGHIMQAQTNVMIKNMYSVHILLLVKVI